jgi:hypothetical protein
MKNIKALAVFNLVAFLLHVSLAYLIQFKLISRHDVGEVSDKYPTLFTPAGITFGIWGVIYIGLTLFCIYHISKAWTKSQLDPTNHDTELIGGWFIINNLAAAGWLLAWVNESLLTSLILMGVQLISLIAIHLNLHMFDPRRTVASRVFTMIPLSIYFAWITIAAITNTCVYLESTGWDGGQLTSVDWTKIMIGIAVLITVLVITTRRNVVYGLVMAWGLYGIIIKRNQVDSDEYFQIIQTAWIGIAILGLVCVLQLIKNNLRPARFDPPFPVAPHSLK